MKGLRSGLLGAIIQIFITALAWEIMGSLPNTVPFQTKIVICFIIFIVSLVLTSILGG